METISPGMLIPKRVGELDQFLTDLLVSYRDFIFILLTKATGSQSVDDVITLLGDHGCKNIGSRLNFASCSAEPVVRIDGDVYQGRLDDGSKVAIKKLRFVVNHLEVTVFASVRVFVSLNILQEAAQELHKWSKCHHRNVIGLLGLVRFQDHIGMVSLWMEHGSLPWYLDDHPNVNRCKMVRVSGPFRLQTSIN